MRIADLTGETQLGMEMERRIDEMERYLEFSQEEREELVAEFARSVGDVFDRSVDDCDPYELAKEPGRRCAEVVISAIEEKTLKLSRRSIEKAVNAAAEGVIRRRMDSCKEYLALIAAERACFMQNLPWRFVRLVAERFDALEDTCRLQVVDFQRLRSVMLPEQDEGDFRKYCLETLLSWQQSVARVLLPESFGDPERLDAPSDTLPGTCERVEVYSERQSAGRRLYSDGDTQLAEWEGIKAGDCQAPGNGKKMASTIDGVPVVKEKVSMLFGTEAPAEPTFEEEWACPPHEKGSGRCPEWARLRPPTVGGGAGRPGVVAGGCVVESKGGADGEAIGPRLFVPGEGVGPADMISGMRWRRLELTDREGGAADALLKIRDQGFRVERVRRGADCLEVDAVFCTDADVTAIREVLGDKDCTGAIVPLSDLPKGDAAVGLSLRRVESAMSRRGRGGQRTPYRPRRESMPPESGARPGAEAGGKRKKKAKKEVENVLSFDGFIG